MTIPALILIQIKPKPVDKYTLDYFQQNFVVRKAENVVRVPLRLALPKPLASIMYRRDQCFAVWDDRGLTLRRGDKVSSTHLDYIPTSPKVFPRAEILRLLPKFKSGERRKVASSLAGSCRIGNNVFFLVRWEDKEYKPWLETLIKVDLAAEKLKPEYMGKLDRFTLATKQIDDRLYASGDNLFAITSDNGRWGVSRFDPKDGSKLESTELGEGLDSILTGPTGYAYVVEKTEYGSRVAARINLNRETRKDLIEAPSKMKFIDATLPELIVINGPTGQVLHNGETGADLILPPSAAVRRAGKQVVVWSPFDNPKNATLYDPARWEAIATWRVGQ